MDEVEVARLAPPPAQSHHEEAWVRAEGGERREDMENRVFLQMSRVCIDGPPVSATAVPGSSSGPAAPEEQEAKEAGLDSALRAAIERQKHERVTIFQSITPPPTPQ